MDRLEVSWVRGGGANAELGLDGNPILCRLHKRSYTFYDYDALTERTVASYTFYVLKMEHRHEHIALKE